MSQERFPKTALRWTLLKDEETQAKDDLELQETMGLS